MNRWVIMMLGVGLMAMAPGRVLAEGAESRGDSRVVVVIGARGLVEYGQMFEEWAAKWRAACAKGEVACEVIGADRLKEGESDKQRLRAAVDSAVGAGADLWLVFIGHGTFNGRVANFNLRGPDVSAQEMGAWIKATESGGGRVALVNGASASAPFIAALSGEGRVIVTSTKSGSEQNFARFGGFMAEAIGEGDADLDKDGQTSLLEAYLMASRRTEAYYLEEGLLASEHALIDDNGDGQGTRAEFYRGIRPIKKVQAGTPDGYAAHQWHLIPSKTERALPDDVRAERDRLEMEVLKLRDNRGDYDEDDYFRLLEAKLVRLAEIYERAGG
ncbi:MAG: hypothetical protein ACYTGQ_09885 [Planctomycetota bacterium]|jgi:hypothetical protein